MLKFVDFFNLSQNTINHKYNDQSKYNKVQSYIKYNHTIHNIMYMHVLSMHTRVTELQWSREQFFSPFRYTFSGMGPVESPPIVTSRHIALALYPHLLSNFLSRLSMIRCNSWLLQGTLWLRALKQVRAFCKNYNSFCSSKYASSYSHSVSFDIFWMMLQQLPAYY